MSKSVDEIELILPFEARYVCIARLTVAGLANRSGFDIEAIEDIKVSVAEVCNKLVNIGSKPAGNYKIIFRVSDSELNVIFACEDKSIKCIFGDQHNQLGLSIIKAFMDEVEYCRDSGYLLTMTKRVEGNN